MDDLTLGRIGYEAYGNFTGWKTYNGKDMPKWDDLTLNIMRAWQAAGEAIRAIPNNTSTSDMDLAAVAAHILSSKGT